MSMEELELDKIRLRYCWIDTKSLNKYIVSKELENIHNQDISDCINAGFER